MSFSRDSCVVMTTGTEPVLSGALPFWMTEAMLMLYFPRIPAFFDSTPGRFETEHPHSRAPTLYPHSANNATSLSGVHRLRRIVAAMEMEVKGAPEPGPTVRKAGPIGRSSLHGWTSPLNSMNSFRRARDIFGPGALSSTV